MDKKQAARNRVKDQHTRNSTSPNNFDRSYDQRCWWRYTLNYIRFKIQNSTSKGDGFKIRKEVDGCCAMAGRIEEVPKRETIFSDLSQGSLP